MSIADITLFLKSIYPFELLSEHQINQIVENIEVVYHRENQKVEDTDTYLYVVLKGVVIEKDPEGRDVNYLGEKDIFDYRKIMNSSQNEFFTADETVFYRVPLAIVRSIKEENQEFSRYIEKSTREKLSSLASESPYLFARIKDIPLQKPLIVSGEISIWIAVKRMTEEMAKSIVVRFEDGYGIVTDTDLRKKVILARKSVDDPIGEIANRNIVSVKNSDFLFDGIITMMKYGIKRVIVKDDEDNLVGILNELDILTQHSNQPQFLALRVEKSKSLEDIKLISESMVNTVRILHREGIRTRHIMKFVSEINQKIFRKLFEILAPEDIRENTCLIIMGSEGREEQILKTDQDNGLLLKDGFNSPLLEDFSREFKEALKKLGYPECKGDVMITNPYWRKSLSDYKRSIFDYVNHINPDNMLKLAILVDLKSVAGESELAQELKEFIFEQISDNRTFLSWFALPTIQFKTPLNIFGGFEAVKGEIDLKKGGIFPIIHGVRALSVEYKLRETNTFSRIKELSKLQIFRQEFAGELIESLEFMLTLRLRESLRKIEAKKIPDDHVGINKLSNLEKDLLKESFRVVNRFKDFIVNHYKLNYIT
ncbi:MAG: DUF294 nucleotidyltransferase-like domain-containing protein [Hydrogenothermaceae bacterium]|nr:DUF294 nucleotidyltransferase-like domain-containing protein [Hydrogenothermaceae bacterium]